MIINSTDAIRNVQQQADTSMKVKTDVSEKNISQMNKMDKASLPVSEKVVIDAIEKANKAVEGFAYTSFEISVHKKTHAIMVKVIDRDTKQVIREIPPEKMLDLVAKLMELSGIFVDERR